MRWKLILLTTHALSPKNAIIYGNYLYLLQKLCEAGSEKRKAEILNASRDGSVVPWQHVSLHGEYDFSARLYPFQTKERATKGPISGITALFRWWFEVDDRHKCQRRAAGVSQVKSLSHNVHGPAEALQPTAICFGKMDKVELRGKAIRLTRASVLS